MQTKMRNECGQRLMNFNGQVEVKDPAKQSERDMPQIQGETQKHCMYIQQLVMPSATESLVR